MSRMSELDAQLGKDQGSELLMMITYIQELRDSAEDILYRATFGDPQRSYEDCKEFFEWMRSSELSQKLLNFGKEQNER